MSDSTITSRQNERVKAAVKLRERRQREKQGRFLIDGAREIQRAMQAGVALVEAFVCPALCRSAESQAARMGLAASGANVALVTEEVFAKLAFGDREEGLVAVAELPSRPLGELPLSDQMLVAVVEGIEKPGNLGAILRSADAVGASAAIVTGQGTDPWNPNVIRAGLGTVFTVPVRLATEAETLAWLRGASFKLYATRVEGAALYNEVDLTGRTAIILGSEASGLSEAWRDEELTAIRLPMLGAADSLNVAATASVLFYEALRQRQRVQ